MLTGTKTWLKQNVTVAPHSTLNASGIYSFGTPITIPCLIVQKNTNTMDRNGNEVMSKAQVLVDGGTTITTLDQITLPDGTVPHILNVLDIPNIVNGLSYAKIIYI